MKSQSLEEKHLQTLIRISENLERLNEKMEVMIELQSQGRKDFQSPMETPVDAAILLSLPDYLRKTFTEVCKRNNMTATEVAQQTKRARAVESSYLNRLVVMGYLKKKKDGRKTYFYI